MTTSGNTGRTSAGRRIWLFFMAAGWALFGMWSLDDGRTALGSGQLAMAVVTLAAGLSHRVASFVDAPVFRRKSSKIT